MEQIRRLRYSPLEAAKALGISKAKLYQHINAGEISSYVIDNRRWFLSIDLEEFIQKQRAASGQGGAS